MLSVIERQTTHCCPSMVTKVRQTRNNVTLCINCRYVILIFKLENKPLLFHIYCEPSWCITLNNGHSVGNNDIKFIIRQFVQNFFLSVACHVLETNNENTELEADC